MREEKIGGLKARIAGGTDRQGGGDGPIVVLLHGFGAPGEDLVPLHRVIDAKPGTRFVFPEAPIALGAGFGGGRAWWNIDMMRLQMQMARGDMRDLRHEIPDGIVPAREQVVAFLGDLGRVIGAPSPDHGIFLGGFSQGAMLSTDVALHESVALEGLVLLSGSYVAEAEWKPRMASRTGLRVLQSHGREDPILPFALAESLRDDLRAAGLSVEWVPFRGGHGIAPEVLAALGPFLRAARA